MHRQPASQGPGLRTGPQPAHLCTPQQVAARLEYDEFVRRIATAGGHCGSYAFRSSLFVPRTAAFRYSGEFDPLPMLQLAGMRRLQVRRAGRGGRGALFAPRSAAHSS